MAAKTCQTGLMSEKSLRSMSNRIHVTIKDMLNVFDLKAPQKPDDQSASLVGELIATEMLLDPQKFVQGPWECATTTLASDRYGVRSIRLRQSLK